VAEQRAQVRSAAAQLKALEGEVMPQAEAAARLEHPELIVLCDEAAAQEEQIRARVAQCGALVKVARQAPGRKLTVDEARHAGRIAAEAEDTLQQGDAWIARVRRERQQADAGGPESDSQGAGKHRPLHARHAKLHQRSARSGRDADAWYMQGSNLLTRLREQSADISTERKRAELRLSQFARQIAKQNEVFSAFSASADRLDTASIALTAALRHLLIPEVLSFAYGTN
jgi:hypothetical protein